MKITFIASEGVPYSKTGGLADVVGALPKALAKNGHQVDVLLPLYRITLPRSVMPLFKSVTIPLAAGFRFATIQDAGEAAGVHTYLIDCPEFFDREGIYQEKGGDFPDNALRFAAFSLACLEFMQRSASAPDVIHCHDWQSALVPIYLRNLYQRNVFFANSSVLFTIHNLEYQGIFPPNILPPISLPTALFTMENLEFYGRVNLLKGGVVFSDLVSTVSPKYAAEIQTPELGHGLDGVFRIRAGLLHGILNGVDYDDWNPATDPRLPAKYSPEDLKGKEACKRGLLENMGARNPTMERPVIGIVSRFVSHKGFDLIARIAERLLSMDVYLVALGTGEPQFEEFFRSIAARYPDRFLLEIGYDESRAHQIYAGADIFLMPSRAEPCGLSQMYSLKYGTVPVVRATGGLDDTIQSFDGVAGTGYKFTDYTPAALLECAGRALADFRQPLAWRQLMLNGMKKDYSWAVSAREYGKIYESLRQSKVRIKSFPGASNS